MFLPVPCHAYILMERGLAFKFGMKNGGDGVADLGELIRAARERQSAGAFPEAAELWRGILWRHPRHEDRAAWAYSYAEALRQNGEESRAAALLGRMQIVYPDRAEGFVGLALMHQSAGAYDLALAC